MAERLKRAAAWLGLVTDDRYGDYDDHDDSVELTEGISREDLLADGGREDTGNVTKLESRRPAGAHSTASTAPSAAAGSNTAGSTAVGSNAPGSNTAASNAAPTATITPRTADMARITTVHPRTYNEARVIGEHFRDGVPVIMNLSEMEDADAKRLVDFAAGLIFGLRGTIERVTSKVFLLCPPNVDVSSEDKERIAGGFFNQS
jgi:cell division inhibitor SepF